MPYLRIDIAINAKRFLKAYVNYNFARVELSFPPSAEGSLDIFAEERKNSLHIAKLQFPGFFYRKPWLLK